MESLKRKNTRPLRSIAKKPRYDENYESDSDEAESVLSSLSEKSEFSLDEIGAEELYHGMDSSDFYDSDDNVESGGRNFTGSPGNIEDLGLGKEEQDDENNTKVQTKQEIKQLQVKAEVKIEWQDIDEDKEDDLIDMTQNAYRCHYKQCTKSFKSMESKQKHIIDDHWLGYSDYKTRQDFICNICDKTVKRRSLRNHLLACQKLSSLELQEKKDRMNVSKKFECEIEGCDYKALTKRGLYSHIKNKHTESRYFCDECDFSAFYQSIINKHKENSHSTQVVSCKEKFCNYTTSCRTNLVNHEKRVHQIYRCDKNDCYQIFSSYKLKQKHHERDHSYGWVISNNDDLDCKYCGKQFKTVQLLGSHARMCKRSSKEKLDEIKKIQEQRNKSDRKKFPCKVPDCGFVATCTGTLYSHMQTAMHSKETYACDKCDYVTKNKYGLNQHKKRRHPEIEVIYKCKQENCSYTSTMKSNLTTHEERMHQIVRCHFEGCDKIFETMDAKKLHIMKDHRFGVYLMDDSNLVCKFCDSKFTSKQGIRFHMYRCQNKTQEEWDRIKQMNSDRLYHCDICNRNFTDPVRHVNHMKKYHDIKIERQSKQIFKCEIKNCDYTTDRRMNFNKHVKYLCKHLDKEELKCGVKDCTYTTKNKYYMKQHIQSVHETSEADRKKYECRKCEKVFNYKEVRKQHEMVVHKFSADGESFEKLCCKKCEYVGKTKKYLENHLKIHDPNNGGKFVCDICDARFSTSLSCNNHRKKSHVEKK